MLSALEQLIAEGYLQGERGSGTYVTAALPDEASLVPKISRPESRPREKRAHPAMSRGVVAEVRFPQLPDGPLRPFRLGIPALEDFPGKLWVTLLHKHWRHGASELLGVGNPMGLLRLRRAVAAYLTAARAVRCDTEQVVIVAGAQQALDLTARLLLKPGDSAWIEEPGYLGIRAVLHTAGARVHPVPVDEEGLDVHLGVARYPNARLVYVTPSHQFPLGITMSLTRRLELLAWAQAGRRVDTGR